MRLGGTTLASFKNESVAKCGWCIYYGMFSSFFPVDAGSQHGRRRP